MASNNIGIYLSLEEVKAGKISLNAGNNMRVTVLKDAQLYKPTLYLRFTFLVAYFLEEWPTSIDKVGWAD